MLDLEPILREKNITKTQLARTLNISRQSLHSILAGNPTLSKLEMIATALGCQSVGDMLLRAGI